jgi:DNA repair photolyase
MVNFVVKKASKGKIVSDSGFQGYDVCLNPYIGCQFGCSYCYVRFFVKDPVESWGNFVRTRDHLPKRLLKETSAVAGKRVVLGTMTDPYQPIERQKRLTRQALQWLIQSGASKVGIFTRSPIVLDDLDLIVQLPRARVHFTIPLVLRAAQILMEPIPVLARARWEVVKKLKASGIKVNVNIAPAIPILSDTLVEETVKMLSELNVDEFFVDSMQAYSESWAATKTALAGHPDFSAIVKIVENKTSYNIWKAKHRDEWMVTWRQFKKLNTTLAIWCDHQDRV